MFFYGMYKSNLMQTPKGVIALLSDFETGSIERGMEYIAFSQIEFIHLDGWRHFICGCNVEDMVCECNRYWTKKTGEMKGRWMLYRLDRKSFIVKDHSGKKPKQYIVTELTFC